MTFRIATVCPVDARSAIGKMALLVSESLAELGAEVQVVASDREIPPPDQRLPIAFPFREWRRADVSRLRSDFDAVVVHLGDNYDFHAGAVPLLRDDLKTIGVFHDSYLYNLHEGWLQFENRHDPEAQRIRSYRELYGQAGETFAREFPKAVPPIEEIALRAPMTEWFAPRLRAFVTHAAFYAPRIAAASFGPGLVLPLPVAPRPGVVDYAPRPDGPVRVLTVGWMNPNKQADAVIRAIGGSERLRERAVYRLAGMIHDGERARLEGLARELGIRLEALGTVSEERLDQELSEADVIVTLRKPILEGASGSAIEGLLSGRPLVVADAGFYGEIPDGLVVKTPASIEEESIRSALEYLVARPDDRAAMGRRARAWALERFRPEPYAEGLLRLARAVKADEAAFPARRALIERLWFLGLRRGDPAAERARSLFPTPAA